MVRGNHESAARESHSRSLRGASTRTARFSTVYYGLPPFMTVYGRFHGFDRFPIFFFIAFVACMSVASDECQ